MSLALHPETTADPAVLRWVITGRSDSLAGPVEAANSPLQQLLREGVLAAAVGGPGWVETTLSEGHAWWEIGNQVRSAVAQSVSAAAQGEVTEADLRGVAQEVLERDVAPIAGAHGGRIEIVSVTGRTVRVSLDGACHGCPAAKVTLHERFQTSLRERVPDAVVEEDPRSAAATRPRTDGASRLPFPMFRKH